MGTVGLSSATVKQSTPTALSFCHFSFQLAFNTCVSANSAGTFSAFANEVKKTLMKYPTFPEPVGAASFNSDGTIFADHYLES